MIAIHMSSFRKERKVFETYQKQLLSKPNRKERQELEALRDEVRMYTYAHAYTQYVCPSVTHTHTCTYRVYSINVCTYACTQLRQMQEEMKTKESRWGASLARYRLRIETLETQNKELQNDLHMMEQERLKQWQLQV